MKNNKYLWIEIRTILSILLVTTMLLSSVTIYGQKESSKKEPKKEESVIKSDLVSGLKFRNIGPAYTSGRIADFAVNPANPFEYYVAVASGHVWKTMNNGITFEPVFDNYGTYSIGCITMDPTNSNVLWIGTGENNHQRALGYGNGVYKTVDGGKSWKNMGLKESRQIGMIAIDPEIPILFMLLPKALHGDREVKEDYTKPLMVVQHGIKYLTLANILVLTM